MKANDARKLSAASASNESADVAEKTELLLVYWRRAIEAAARSGRRSVHESEIGVPRTPVPAAARKAVVPRLQADGFVVATVNGVVEVSW